MPSGRRGLHAQQQNHSRKVIETVTKHKKNADLIPEIGKWLQDIHSLKSGQKITFPVKGRSMRAMIDGDRDAVEMTAVPEGYELKPMDVVLAEVAPKRYVLHRIIKRKGDKLMLMGDGNLRGTEICRVENVIGIATAFVRKGKRLDMNSRTWKIYSKFWVKFKPLRRFMIFAMYPHVPYKLQRKNNKQNIK